MEALERRWLLLNCHRMGKELALAEMTRDAAIDSGVKAEPEVLERVAFYEPRIRACIDSGKASGEVRIPTADGGVVHGKLHGEGVRGLVLAHGGRFTKESWSEQIPTLVDAGFRVLAIDFRGRGRSRGPSSSTAGGEPYDVLAAVRYLRSTGSLEVSVIGASFGGWAAGKAAVMAEPGEIQAVVLLAHSPFDEIGMMPGRKLFVVARDDVQGEARIPRLPSIRLQFEDAPEPKRLWVLDGEAHAQFLFDTEQATELLRGIIDFLLDDR